MPELWCFKRLEGEGLIVAPSFVLSIDWDFFVGDSSQELPCKLCRWSCDKQTNWQPELRENQTKKKAPSEKVVADIFQSPVINQFWWHRWEDVPVVVADCHASLYKLLPESSFIYNIDHHMDTDPMEWGYNQGPLTCATWATKAINLKKCLYYWCYDIEIPSVGKPKLWLQPYRKSAAVECPWRRHQPNLVFFCLSSPYTNPVYDDYFYKAVHDLCTAIVGNPGPQFVGLGACSMKRKYREAQENLGLVEMGR